MLGRKVKKKVWNLPKSATTGWICFIGLISFMISLYFIRIYNISNSSGAVLSGMALVIPIILFEMLKLKTYKRSSTGLDFRSKNKPDFERVVIKLIGLYATLALISFFYWIFPEYRGNIYTPYWLLAKNLLKVIAIGAIPYFFILDKYLVEPREAYWKAGMIVLGRGKEISYDGLKNYFLGWLVKAFFLPLMYVALCGNVGVIKQSPLYSVLDQLSFPRFFDYMYNYIYTIDLAFVFVGYLLTLRIFDSHIRTVEPSFLGWYVALQCYQPFWGALSGNYFAYDDGYSWGQWLINNHNLFIFWGCLILLLISVYSWASIYFGIRFSNLTNRGILTNGPYRFLKHPAYISKNLSWWLISIPFVSQQGFIPGLKNCLLLLAVNFLYYLRARTEERHLSQDPVYVQYATAMNERGIFKKLYKIFPFLRYNPDNAANAFKIN